jgi:hypothetical protein
VTDEFWTSSFVLFLIDDETLILGNANRFAAWKLNKRARIPETMLPRMHYAKAPEGWRIPRRFAKFRRRIVGAPAFGVRQPSAAF